MTTAALGALRQYLPELHGVLRLGDDPVLKQWQSALDIKLLPRAGSPISL